MREFEECGFLKNIFVTKRYCEACGKCNKPEMPELPKFIDKKWCSFDTAILAEKVNATLEYLKRLRRQ